MKYCRTSLIEQIKYRQALDLKPARLQLSLAREILTIAPIPATELMAAI
jgi:hypothetical protein